MSYLMLLCLLVQAEEVDRATLGVETRTPDDAETKMFNLKCVVRVAGRVVKSVEEDSPAAKAGIKKGDVILTIGGYELHSDDALRDFLRVAKPDSKVKVKLKRAKDQKEEEIEVTLGSKKVEKKGITWQYAGLEQLDAAIAKAKKEEKIVLVGISGAET